MSHPMTRISRQKVGRLSSPLTCKGSSAGLGGRLSECMLPGLCMVSVSLEPTTCFCTAGERWNEEADEVLPETR